MRCPAFLSSFSVKKGAAPPGSAFYGGSLLLVLERLIKRVPGEHGAFDARGHVADALEREGLIEILQLRLVRDLALDHADEFLRERARLLDALAADEVDHHVGRGLADGAADARERGVLDDAVLDLELERDLVAAARVVSLEGAGRAQECVAVLRIAAVLAPELRVDVFKAPSRAPP